MRVKTAALSEGYYRLVASCGAQTACGAVCHGQMIDNLLIDSIPCYHSRAVIFDHSATDPCQSATYTGQ